ncbi:efflux RND transporter periplasmic adaptor subunit [Sphingomonas quercus]|uniref:Efflux RND transporter periplasmic adaptor subunit n=1 Tax=Sphingomonas quercus TaxID=2842451 RepID=A0ABS6BHG8_9SPHN|nr:efflux RND transporter periplasmic adaptor subunit [Sphingomonas quercus]MBU3076675.1 efflux RND transporter periplasmic adaptor subunit [Sphingomonas quercus]
MSDERQSRNLKFAGIGAAVLAIAVVAAGITARNSNDHALIATAADAAVPTVDIITPSRSKTGEGLTLPGNVQAFNTAPIYARSNGYVRRWLADIGDNVKAGQTLAILDAPEIEQQLQQAHADYQTALAEQRLAQTTAERWKTLRAKDAVSQQEADEKAGDYAAKTAVANAQAANVRRLTALTGFTRLEAPFAGVVTSRSAQIGALVTAGSAAAQPLFTVSDVHRMRTYVRVPQGFSAEVHTGLQATLTLPEYPGRKFAAEVTRTARAVDQQSGTVLVELQSDNRDGALKPGAYAQVQFPFSSAAGTMKLPSTALIFKDEGPQVAVVDANGRVQLRTVTVGRDEGAEIEVTSGLAGNERVINSPPDALDNGDQVRVGGGSAAAK